MDVVQIKVLISAAALRFLRYHYNSKRIGCFHRQGRVVKLSVFLRRAEMFKLYVFS
jgi:hypothetical protein